MMSNKANDGVQKTMFCDHEGATSEGTECSECYAPIGDSPGLRRSLCGSCLAAYEDAEVRWEVAKDLEGLDAKQLQCVEVLISHLKGRSDHSERFPTIPFARPKRHRRRPAG